MASIPQVSPPKPWIRLSYPPYALHAPPIQLAIGILNSERRKIRLAPDLPTRTVTIAKVGVLLAGRMDRMKGWWQGGMEAWGRPDGRMQNTHTHTHTHTQSVKSVPVTGPVVVQRVGRGIALLFHDRGTRRGWVVSSTPRPYFTPGKAPVPIVQEAGWGTGPEGG